MLFYTKNVAYQLFRENSIGKLEVGMRADFVVLDQSPIEINPHDIREIKILGLYKNGVRFK
jgi:predicted amidohydrolase YtcJ